MMSPDEMTSTFEGVCESTVLRADASFAGRISIVALCVNDAQRYSCAVADSAEQNSEQDHGRQPAESSRARTQSRGHRQRR